MRIFCKNDRWANRQLPVFIASLLMLAVGPLFADEDVIAEPAVTESVDPAAGQSAPVIVVNKTPTCGCCTKWVDILKSYGFEVEVNTVPNTRGVQAELGVPRQLGSCHTAKVGNYFVEGHVPPEIIQQLIEENRDDIVGIGVPGMPAGSPGMESPNPVQYDVLAYGKDGKFYKYATVPGKS